MKNIKNISMSLLLLAGTTLTSCSDFLDGSQQNKSNIDESSITPEQRRNEAFSTARDLYNGGSFLKMFVKGTDIYINQSGDATGEEFYAYKLTSSTAEVKSLYATLYDVINNCNAAITYDNSLVDCDARFMRALCYYNLTQQFGDVPLCKEAITTSERNYPRTPVKEIYDYIIQDLKNVYASGKLDNTNHEGHASKASVAALTAKISLAAGWDCEVTVTDKAKGTYSFDGDTYGYFGDAKEYATNAITAAGGKDALCPSYEEKWSPKNEGNSEELFSIQYSRTVSADEGTELSGGNQWWFGFGGYYGAATDGIKLMNHQDNPNKKMLALYTEGDKRFDATFMTSVYDGKNWDAGEGYMAYYNNTPSQLKNKGIKYRFLPAYYTYDQMKADFDANKEQYKKGACTVIRLGDNIAAYTCNASTTDMPKEADLISQPYYTNAGNTSYTGYLKSFSGRTYTGMACKKWDDPKIDNSSTKTQGYRDVVILSLSEVFLLRAEAEVMLGGDYLADVNIVRQRSGAQPIATLASYDPAYSHTFTLRPIDIVLDERAIELFAEGKRWEDLRRTKQLQLYYNEFNNNAADATVKWLRPIPVNEISANTGISESDQNEGY